jgi:hypothetical protein
MTTMTTDRHPNDPQPGWFLAKSGKDHPLMPARIWRPCVCTIGGEDEHDWQESCDRYPALAAEINGQPADVDRVWMSRDVITEEEFRYLTDTAAWDRQNDPAAPLANPNKPIDPLTVKTLF